MAISAVQTDLGQALNEVDRYASRLDAEAGRYWDLHRKRFQWVAGYLQDRFQDGFRMLDVGNSFQTTLLSKALPYSVLDTIGYFDHRFPSHEGSRHFAFDLNDSYYPDRWPSLEGDGYDLILFLEVIEHLYTSPKQVLDCLRSLLKPGGEILIQTPNAAALKKRWKLLWGRNPYELIRESRESPGHFRELTVADLKRYARQTGFSVSGIWMDSHLVDGKPFDRFCDRISRWLPGGLRGGISISLKRADA